MAPDGDVRDARYAHQAWPDLPSRQQGHVDQRQSFRRESDEHHAARRRERLEHLRGLRDLGKRVRLREALFHDLARIEQVRAGLEDHLDRRQSRDRLRPDRVEERHAVEQVLLERDRDQLFDLGRREPQGLGLDLDRRPGKLREDFPRHVGDAQDADGHEDRGQRDHDATSPQARTDDPAKHRNEPPCEGWVSLRSYGTGHRASSSPATNRPHPRDDERRRFRQVYRGVGSTRPES